MGVVGNGFALFSSSQVFFLLSFVGFIGVLIWISQPSEESSSSSSDSSSSKNKSNVNEEEETKDKKKAEVTKFRSESIVVAAPRVRSRSPTVNTIYESTNETDNSSSTENQSLFESIRQKTEAQLVEAGIQKVVKNAQSIVKNEQEQLAATALVKSQSEENIDDVINALIIEENLNIVEEPKVSTESEIKAIIASTEAVFQQKLENAEDIVEPVAEEIAKVLENTQSAVHSSISQVFESVREMAKSVDVIEEEQQPLSVKKMVESDVKELIVTTTLPRPVSPVVLAEKPVTQDQQPTTNKNLTEKQILESEIKKLNSSIQRPDSPKVNLTEKQILENEIKKLLLPSVVAKPEPENVIEKAPQDIERKPWESLNEEVNLELEKKKLLFCISATAPTSIDRNDSVESAKSDLIEIKEPKIDQQSVTATYSTNAIDKLIEDLKLDEHASLLTRSQKQENVSGCSSMSSVYLNVIEPPSSLRKSNKHKTQDEEEGSCNSLLGKNLFFIFNIILLHWHMVVFCFFSVRNQPSLSQVSIFLKIYTNNICYGLYYLFEELPLKKNEKFFF